MSIVFLKKYKIKSAKTVAIVPQAWYNVIRESQNHEGAIMLIQRFGAAAAAVLCGVLCLSGCSHKENTGAGFQFTCTLEQNPDCQDPQFTDNP